MRRLIVLGGGSPIGRRVVDSLRRQNEYECVVGIERFPFRDPARNEDLEFHSWFPDHRPFAEYLLKEEIDTVIDCGLVRDRAEAAAQPSGAKVISCMYLGAALASPRSPVRSWILASSTAFYSSESHMPLLHKEAESSARLASALGASIAEAEAYARSLAIRLPHVNVAILRLQEIAGRDVRGPVATLLARNLVPRMLGFDSPIQLLHVEDAANALSWAATVELAGIYNVSSQGMLRWAEAIAGTGHRSFPILPISFSAIESLLERLEIPFVPSALFDLLRYGQAVDIEKMRCAGWSPTYDQGECLATLT